MSDRAVVGLAAAIALGAWVAWPLPLPVAAGVVAAGLAVRRPAVLIVAGLLLASSLSARSWVGLTPPSPGSEVAGTATLVTDPEWTRFGQLQVEVRIGGRRLLASARGMVASRLVTRMAGERVSVEGVAGPLRGRAAGHFARRHIAARVELTSVRERPDPGSAVDRLANHVRRLLHDGSQSMAPDHRALFAGFLLGDDRHQPPETVYDFRASGLSHLLAVSGQNVAFVLALAGPLLRRLRLSARMAVGLAVLAVFGVLTRWEPTVLRAVAMATWALLATTLGRPASALRLVALAVSALLLIDPLLVGSVGFQLSVAASVGIVVLGPPLRERLPGPRVIAEPMAVTIAAQAAVAPILVAAFDGVPVAALPANLLAGPAAGPIMMWGLVGGVAAGLIGEPAAAVLHVPTRLLIAWVANVATWSAALPLGDLGRLHLVLLGTAGGIAIVAGPKPPVRRACVAAMAAVVALSVTGPMITAPARASGEEVAAGTRVWRTPESTVVVIDNADAVAALTALRRARVRDIDALVTTSDSGATAEAVHAVTSRVPTRVVVHVSRSTADR